MQADSQRKVVDLLVEQVECADFLILNKMDRMTSDSAAALEGTVATINPTAAVICCEFGKVPLETVIGPPRSVEEREILTIPCHSFCPMFFSLAAKAQD